LKLGNSIILDNFPQALLECFLNLYAQSGVIVNIARSGATMYLTGLNRKFTDYRLRRDYERTFVVVGS